LRRTQITTYRDFLMAETISCRAQFEVQSSKNRFALTDNLQKKYATSKRLSRTIFSASVLAWRELSHDLQSGHPFRR
jgi:hypothetical protein